MDIVVRETNKKPELQLLFSGVKNVYWKYRGFLTDPRLFFTFEDESVLMSGPLCADESPALLEQIYKEWIELGTEVTQNYEVSSVGWKYGKNVHDKRLVFYCEDGEVFASGPFSPKTNVVLLSQILNKKSWIEGKKDE
jgi:hypothetical protein